MIRLKLKSVIHDPLVQNPDFVQVAKKDPQSSVEKIHKMTALRGVF